MAKVLRLHKESNDNIIDWGKSKRYGKDVINQIEDPDGMNARKEITSIPSPFARVDLAKTAFKSICDSRQIDGDTIYHKIVSHSLDVGEIFFNYEKLSSKLDIIVWDRDQELERLCTSDIEEHQILGQTLKMYLMQDANTYNFNEMQRIYLLNYKGKNKPAQMNIIGATSPSTLFISSANNLSYASEELKSSGKYDGLDVGGSRVAHVLVPAVLRVFQSQFPHVFVPVGLRQDRSGGDRGEFSVSFDHTCVADVFI